MNSQNKKIIFSKNLYCSQDKSLSKSTRIQGSFYQPAIYLNSSHSQSQMKTLYSNKSFFKKPINLYAIRNNINTVLKPQSSIIQKDISQLINDYSFHPQQKWIELLNQQHKQSLKILNKRKIKAIQLKKEKTLIDLSSSMNYSYQKAIHDPLLRLKYYKKNIMNISKDVISDYQNTSNANKMRHSKRKYHRILDLYYEQKKAFLKKNVMERETIFNEAKESVYDVVKPKKFKGIGKQKKNDQISSSTIYKTEKELYDKFNNRKDDEKAKKFADSICNIDCKPYSEINARKAKKTFDKYDKQNLARSIKISTIENNKVDVDDMEYYLSNNKLLKKLLEQNQLEMQNEEKQQLKSNIIKKYFKQSTLNKVKMYNGFYFGVPV